ncbi:MAG: hypothetical protein WC869_00470 [Phycisphaerae bacterium]|jgi:hypothetical protein
MRVRVTNQAEITKLMELNPGYAATQTVIGPMNIMLTLTPRAKR